MRQTFASTTVAFAMLLLPGGVRAQSCAPGMERTPEGYCCWPAQRWMEEQNRCGGPPRCPTGMVGAGADCVPAEATSEEETGSPDVRAESASAAATPEQMPWEEDQGGPDPRAASRRPDTRAVIRTPGGPDTGAIAAGLSMFLAAWIPSIVVGVTLMQSSGTCDRESGAIFIVPVGGPIAGLAVNGGRGCPQVDTGYWVLGIADALLQAGGLGIFIAGLAVRTEQVTVVEEVRLDVGLGRVQLTLAL